MRNEVLLISADDALVSRIQPLLRNALGSTPIERRTSLDQVRDWQGWPLLLLDESAIVSPAQVMSERQMSPDSAEAEAQPQRQTSAEAEPERQANAEAAPERQVTPDAHFQEDDAAVALIEQLHARADGPAIVLLGGAAAQRPDAFRMGAIDFIHKQTGLSQLPFVVQEQWNGARLRHSRKRQENEELGFSGGAGFSLRHEINNPLAAILGNAELALSSKSRVPHDVRERLQHIVDLAIHIREVLTSPEARKVLSDPKPEAARSAASGAS